MIDSGTVDRRRVENLRWRRVDFSPTESGRNTIRLSWKGNADLRFSIFKASSGERIATTYDSPVADEWSGYLDASEQYAISVWAVTGMSRYTATVEADSSGTGPVARVSGSLVPVKRNGVLGLKPQVAWSAGGEVHSVIVVGDTLYVGGDFTTVYSPSGDVLSRTYLAAFDRDTGMPTDFAPALNDDVRAFELSPDGNTLYVGGAFDTVDGQSRKRIAAFDVGSGRLTGFNPPGPNGALRAIAVTDSRVYAGGLFTEVGGNNRPYVAAFDPDSGALDTRFAARPSDNVKALVAGREGLWIGGDFSQLNGNRQRGVGLVDLVDGSRKFSDEVTAEVIDMAGSNKQLFIAVGGPGGRAVAFDRASGKEQWTVASDGNFQGVDVDDGPYVYFGGHYEIVEGNKDADRFTRHDKSTGKMDTSWLPSANGIRSVNAVDVTPEGLYIGGDFTMVSGKRQAGFAIFSGSTN